LWTLCSAISMKPPTSPNFDLKNEFCIYMESFDFCKYRDFLNMTRTKQTARKSTDNRPRLEGFGPWPPLTDFPSAEVPVDFEYEMQSLLHQVMIDLQKVIDVKERDITFFAFNIYKKMKEYKQHINKIAKASGVSKAEQDKAWSSIKELVSKETDNLKEKTLQKRLYFHPERHLNMRRLVNNDFEVMKESQMIQFTVDQADSESDDGSSSSDIEDYESNHHSESQSDNDESESQSDKDQSESESQSDKDQSESESQSDKDQSESESQSDKDKSKSQSDKDKSKSQSDKDKSKSQSDKDKSKSQSHKHESESESQSDKDESESKKNKNKTNKVFTYDSNSESDASSSEAASSKKRGRSNSSPSSAMPGTSNPILETLTLPNGNLWNKHFSTKQGKPYWYNHASKQSSWTKPS